MVLVLFVGRIFQNYVTDLSENQCQKLSELLSFQCDEDTFLFCDDDEGAQWESPFKLLRYQTD